MGGFVDQREVLTFDDIKRGTPDLYPGLLKRDVLEDDKVPEGQTDPSTTIPLLTDDGVAVVVSSSEIHDKSKADGVTKLLTIGQTTWFILQFIERWVARQPRAQLEIMTVAYAILNIGIYALWWHKPLNVIEPIDVSGRVRSGVPRRTIGVWGSEDTPLYDAY